MSAPVIISTSPLFGKIGATPALLSRKGWTVEQLVPSPGELHIAGDSIQQRMAAMASTAEFLVVGHAPATAAFISQAKKLKAILKHGVGVENIDIATATAHGIPVCNTPGVNAHSVAELVVGCMIAVGRRIVAGHQSLVSGGWARHVGTEIMGKTLGIVGLGAIGKTLAQKAAALGMNIIAADAYPDHVFAAAHGIRYCPLPELLAGSDFVSLHVFGGAQNENLIGAEQIALLRPSACLMNFARGEVLDVDAASDALHAGRLSALVLDAYRSEPPDRRHPVFTHPNALCLPHSGGDTMEAQERVAMRIIEDIGTIMDGGRPIRVLNKEIYQES